MSTVAKYLRLSSEDDDLKLSSKLESNSIANQRNLLDSYIRRIPEFEDAEILEFCDDGWSGKTFERPAVQEMLDLVRQGKIDCIIVKDLSRFGRDYLTVGNYISRVFPFMGVRFIAVNDGFDSIRPMDADSLETSFKTLLYDLYSRDLSRKVRSAKRFRAQRGDFLSPFAPYDFIKDPDNRKCLKIDPEAAEIVRRIFQLMGEGRTAIQIARILNLDGVPTPMRYKRAAGCSRTVWPCIDEDNFWTHHAVTIILRDERYIGKAVYGKRTRDMVGHTHTVKVSKVDWITVENTHAGIVTREEFDRAQANLRTFEEHDGVSPYRLLQRKVRCGICGHIMRRVGTGKPYYSCSTPLVTDAYSCPTEKIQESEILDTLLGGLRVQAETAVEMGRVWEELHKKHRKDYKTIWKNIAALKEDKNKLAQYTRDLYETYALEEIDKATYLAAKAAADLKCERIDTRIVELEAELENTTPDGRLNNRFVAGFAKYIGVEEITREMVSDVLSEVLVYPDGRLEIVWNYGADYKKLLLDLTGEQKNGKIGLSQIRTA